MLSLEVLLIAMTFNYISKFKSLLKSQSDIGKTELSNITKHLIEQEDHYIVQKKQQANLVIVALLANFILHLGELLLYTTRSTARHSAMRTTRWRSRLLCIWSSCGCRT